MRARMCVGCECRFVLVGVSVFECVWVSVCESIVRVGVCVEGDGG